MSDHTGIEWTDATWNPTTGCTKVSSACAHCYIERTPPFRMKGRKFVNGHVPLKLHEGRLEQPLRWRKPKRIFVNSLSDLFHADVPDAFIDRVFAVMALCPQHTFQVLTKRPERMRAYFESKTEERRDGRIRQLDLQERIDDAAGEFGACHANLDDRWPLPNVWLGVSVENQHFADERIPLLLQTQAAVRFISAEPLLGPVDLSKWLGGNHGRIEECRGSGLQSGGVRPTGGRRRGAHLADAPEAQAGGEAVRGLPSGPGDDQWDPTSCAGAPAGLAPLQGADSARVDGQSREWEQARQPANQSDARDELRADSSCRQGSGPVPTGRPAESSGQIDASVCRGNQEAARGRRATEVDRGLVQCERSDDLEDRTRSTLDWIISGGESGPKARPSHPDWFRSLRDQCQAAGVAFHFKQWGEWAPSDAISGPRITSTPVPNEYRVTNLDGARLLRVGKKAAGRLLDGREWNEFPEVRS
jgi:protein gp37